MSNVTEAVDLLIERDRQPHIEALLSACVRPLDTLQAAIEGMLEWRDLAAVTAGGTVLDAIGSILDVPRNAMSDVDYHAELALVMATRQSDGSKEAILRLARLIMSYARIVEYPPASYVIMQGGYGEVEPGDDYHRPRLAVALDKASAAGVGIAYISSGTPPTSTWTPFRYGGAAYTAYSSVTAPLFGRPYAHVERI